MLVILEFGHRVTEYNYFNIKQQSHGPEECHLLSLGQFLRCTFTGRFIVIYLELFVMCFWIDCCKAKGCPKKLFGPDTSPRVWVLGWSQFVQMCSSGERILIRGRCTCSFYHILMNWIVHLYLFITLVFLELVQTSWYITGYPKLKCVNHAFIAIVVS